jgi:hypothetical protein
VLARLLWRAVLKPRAARVWGEHDSRWWRPLNRLGWRFGVGATPRKACLRRTRRDQGSSGARVGRRRGMTWGPTWQQRAAGDGEGLP